MKNRRQNYLSYLLRVWRTGSDKDGVWLASLTNPFTGEQLGFASLKELLSFLQSRVDDEEQQAAGEEEDPGA
jgi:hypothetical protein